MYWPAKPTGTTKLSHAGRQVLVQRAGDVIQRLEAIRARALQHSTLESVTMLAAEVPLPHASASEQVDLWGDSSDGACSWLRAIAPPSEEPGWQTWEDSEEPACEELQDDQDGLAIEGSWLELLYLAPEAADAFRFLSLAIAESDSAGELPSATNEVLDCGQDLGRHHLDEMGEEGVDIADGLPLEEAIMPSHADSAKPVSSDASPEKRLAHGRAGRDTFSEGAVQEDSHVLSPWAETFPGILEAHLECLDKTSPTPRCPTVPYDSVPVTSLELPQAAATDATPRVSTNCLLRLQKSIGEAHRYREIVKEGLRSARGASGYNSSR